MTRTTVAAVGGTNMNADHNIVELEAEVTRLRAAMERQDRILAALREPNEAVLMGAHQQLKGIFPGYLVPVIRAAVAAAEQEVGQ